jgi:peptide/nickel transport system permease protein
MAAFLLQRAAILVATLIFASFVVFGVLEVLPGNAAETILGVSATPDSVAALSHKLGLDKPFLVRYLDWVGGALRGDLGESYTYNSPILPLIGDRLLVTLPLSLLAMALATFIALTAGVYAADRRGRGGDATVMAASQVGLAIPSFWLGIVLVLTFAVKLRWAPSGGFPGWSDPLKAIAALLLPAIALGVIQGAILTRMTRSALVDALNEDFLRTARAKGVSRRSALWKHALPNALPPILTIMGLQFANLIAGAVVVENVFVLPGIGRLILQSINNRDVLVVEDCVMGLAVFVIAINMLVDIAAAAIDPRLRARSAQ